VKKWKGHANDFFSEQWLEGWEASNLTLILFPL
jgi:hypothetical protein